MGKKDYHYNSEGRYRIEVLDDLGRWVEDAEERTNNLMAAQRAAWRYRQERMQARIKRL